MPLIMVGQNLQRSPWRSSCRARSGGECQGGAGDRGDLCATSKSQNTMLIAMLFGSWASTSDCHQKTVASSTQHETHIVY